jgi:hypothetical protein
MLLTRSHVAVHVVFKPRLRTGGSVIPGNASQAAPGSHLGLHRLLPRLSQEKAVEIYLAKSFIGGD